MAKNSWLGLFQTKEAKQEKSEIQELKERLDLVSGELEDLGNYDAKFFDIESGTASHIGNFEFGGIEQLVNDAVLTGIYTTETWVYTAVTAIAKTVAGLPFKLERRIRVKEQVENVITGNVETVENDAWTDANGAKLFDLFQYPNDYCTKTEFLMLLVIDLMVCGHYYIYLDSDEDLSLIADADFDDDETGQWGRIRNFLAANTKIKGMYRVPPSLIKPVIKDDGYGVAGYVMQSEYGEHCFDAAEIIQVKLPNPLNQWVGLSPLIAALKPVLLDRFSTEHMIRFYKTGARLGGAIETEKNLNKEQLSRFQRSFENNFTGRHNFHRTLILPPGMTYKQIEQNPAETALLEFAKYNREAILSVYNVPPIKVGILDHANYANAFAQLQIFFTDTVMPILTFIEDGFNMKDTLLPDTKSFRFKFDLSQVEALRENNKELADTAKAMIEAGLSPNEVRKRIWKAKPVTGGDKVKAVEDMKQPENPFPFFGAGAEPGKEKDAVSPAPQPDAATIAADIKPTKLSYSERVAQLTELYMQRDKLPLSEAIRRAVEQAKVEDLQPEDPTPTDPSGAPAPSSDESKESKPAESVQTLEQFIADQVAKLDPGTEVTEEFLRELAALYNQPNKEAEIQPEPEKQYGFGLTKDDVVTAWKGFMESTDPLISKREVEVQKFFKAFKSKLMNEIGANIKSYGLHKARNKDDADEILDPKNFEALIKQYIKEVDEALLQAYKGGFADTLANFKFGIRNEQALEALRKYAASKIKGIVDTTRDQVKDVLVKAFDEGVAVNEVALRLNEKFDEINSGRAMTIARTETLTAVSMGREEKREEFKREFPDKTLKKLWVSAKDDRVRDSHVELDGEVRNLDEEFKEGLRFPRDPNGEAAEVINCRCTDLTFVEADEAVVTGTLTEGSENV